MKANMQKKSQQLCLTSWISNFSSVRAIENMYLSSFFLLLFGGEMIKCRETFYLAAPKGKALVAVFEGCEIDNSRLIHSKRHQIHWNMNSCMCTALACYLPKWTSDVQLMPRFRHRKKIAHDKLDCYLYCIYLNAYVTMQTWIVSSRSVHLFNTRVENFLKESEGNALFAEWN